MRRLLVVLVWALSTAGVVYVANTAVELVDLQVFPEGASIRVLERTATSVPEAEPLVEVPAPTSTTTSLVPAVSTTTSLVPAVSTTTSTVPAVSTTTSTVPVVSTTTVPVAQLLVVDSGTVEARSGLSYRARLASGGLLPYEWSVVSGSLPAGLTLTADGFIEGNLEGSGRFQALVQITDSAGHMETVSTVFVVREYRFIRARGGSATVVVTGDSVGFFSALHGEGFKATQVLRSGPIVVEVAFFPISGDETSWVRCEVVDGVSCTHG